MNFFHHTSIFNYLLVGWFILLVSNFTIVKPDNKQTNSEDVNITANTKIWQNVQQIARDTVVQLFVDVAEFNWLEPYKTPKQRRVSGSGFFIDDMCSLVTNYHVVDESVGIKIQIPSLGKEQFDVEIVGVSPERDIALLRLNQSSMKEITTQLGKIPFLELGDSDKVVRTQEIMALGYPLGQEKLKSTQGIVSGRDIMWNESYIQMTAALNPGNSGGPCLNSSGKVIGINTAIVPDAHGVGYIIPINDVKTVITDLYNIRFLRKPILGCEFNLGTKNLINFLKNPVPGGLYISRVYKNSLLGRVGVLEGDMIYAINEHKFDLYGETNVSWSEDKIPMIALLNRFRLGQKINLEVYRAGKQLKFSFDFDLVPPLPIRQYFPEYEHVDYEIIGGMVLMQLELNHIPKFESENPYLIKYTKHTNQYEPRLIISHIFPTSKTMSARVVNESDVIKEVNGVAVKTLAEFREAIRNTKNYLTIKTYDKKFMVLQIRKILKDEYMLSKKYFYKRSKFIKELCLKFGVSESDSSAAS